MRVVVAGAGYVGLSNATLLEQNNEVYVVDAIKEKCTVCCDGKVPDYATSDDADDAYKRFFGIGQETPCCRH